jgi:uroporphyrinogen III methyltransferase/synthase
MLAARAATLAFAAALALAGEAGAVECPSVTYTRISTASHCAQLLGPDYRERLKAVKLASIGPVTTATLRELGLEPTVQAETFNIDGLVEAMGRASTSHTPSPLPSPEGRGR